MLARCDKGHWYDGSADKECPYCKIENEKQASSSKVGSKEESPVKTGAEDNSLGEELGAIIGNTIGNPSGNFTYTNAPVADIDEDKTVSFGFMGDSDIQPVTGWLVCMNGANNGRDYRLHTGRNFIGRSSSADIFLGEDLTVANDKHCSITYDPKVNKFFVAPEDGKRLKRNEEEIDKPSELEEGDLLTIGETELVFVPFCKEDRKWEEK